jgi:hypothetical protein
VKLVLISFDFSCFSFFYIDVEPDCDNDEYVFDEISQEILLEMYQREVEETQSKLNSFFYYLVLN